ncbi:d(CMP) kinase [Dinoroseobacter sp. PD6]|uniref:(d)CMP kinase n=1 Tax=Dinoroseobacter sp. PD6 TaxID=3028384 RepID=UPI00237C2EC0|nr:d(CMP) kinase [Dinoroseobacter sp. PD6]MDD9715865.1 d(CMP) kinase [Dinoroseobacter sp. PD6]
MNFAIAIDGPAAAGKGTIGRAMAAHFGFPHMDTGLLYRAVGRRVLSGMPALEAARALTPEDLQADGLRTAEVGQAASQVAALPQVRAALLDFQRAFAQRAGGAILDGRDIGTVICPDAAVKLFVTASDDVRAQRRHAELTAKGADLTLEAVLADLQARDARDMQRADAPLKPAEDAMVLDTSRLSIDEAVEKAIALATARMAAREFSPIRPN